MDHAGHAGHSVGDMMPMPMFFINTWHTTLWFESWETKSLLSYMVSCLGLVLFAVLHEAFACYRSRAMARLVAKLQPHTGAGIVSVVGLGALHEALVIDNSSAVGPIKRPGITSLSDKLWAAAMYALNILTSYLLMLAVMTYNVGYLVSVVMGMGLGYALFYDSMTLSHMTGATAAMVSSDWMSDPCHFHVVCGQQ
eukprot:CAMPEP_0119109328 /NCGR_PEP_ID=MMETSP1180-20130426/17848_1 /TAXON_ID=3052 ORGANISM="Chlamydomonas cf sp, Strain CCMP681" /NCGR_SAMPLE_ID=MMETSP1180 /ASSEMBLY_ACC=CAM_ASM_000741 /LENGTH=195 /DNA_ID=CAMNT_0007095071 /DNA_START=152 /DNA_END=740 /DNA_ORIENTATION=-